jgi:hypothetical protein
MTYLYYVMCHNVKPSKINDEDPLSIFSKKIQIFIICHMPLCKLLIFMVVYKWHTIIYRWWNIGWSLTSCTLATCSMQLNVFCNQNIITNGIFFFLFLSNDLKQHMEQVKKYESHFLTTNWISKKWFHFFETSDWVIKHDLNLIWRNKLSKQKDLNLILK